MTSIKPEARAMGDDSEAARQAMAIGRCIQTGQLAGSDITLLRGFDYIGVTLPASGGDMRLGLHYAIFARENDKGEALTVPKVFCFHWCTSASRMVLASEGKGADIVAGPFMRGMDFDDIKSLKSYNIVQAAMARLPATEAEFGQESVLVLGWLMDSIWRHETECMAQAKALVEALPQHMPAALAALLEDCAFFMPPAPAPATTPSHCLCAGQGNKTGKRRSATLQRCSPPPGPHGREEGGNTCDLCDVHMAADGPAGVARLEESHGSCDVHMAVDGPAGGAQAGRPHGSCDGDDAGHMSHRSCDVWLVLAPHDQRAAHMALAHSTEQGDPCAPAIGDPCDAGAGQGLTADGGSGSQAACDATMGGACDDDMSYVMVKNGTLGMGISEASCASGVEAAQCADTQVRGTNPRHSTNVKVEVALSPPSPNRPPLAPRRSDAPTLTRRQVARAILAGPSVSSANNNKTPAGVLQQGFAMHGRSQPEGFLPEGSWKPGTVGTSSAGHEDDSGEEQFLDSGEAFYDEEEDVLKPARIAPVSSMPLIAPGIAVVWPFADRNLERAFIRYMADECNKWDVLVSTCQAMFALATTSTRAPVHAWVEQNSWHGFWFASQLIRPGVHFIGSCLFPDRYAQAREAIHRLFSALNLLWCGLLWVPFGAGPELQATLPFIFTCLLPLAAMIHGLGYKMRVRACLPERIASLLINIAAVSSACAAADGWGGPVVCGAMAYVLLTAGCLVIPALSAVKYERTQRALFLLRQQAAT